MGAEEGVPKLAPKAESAVLGGLSRLVEKVKFKEIMQKLDSGPQSGLAQTAAFVFQQECQATFDLMLPLISKI